MTGLVWRKMQGGSDQNGDTNEATSEAEPDDRGRLRPCAHCPRKKRNVDRHSRHHHRGETGRNILFGQSDATVSAEQETRADN